MQTQRSTTSRLGLLAAFLALTAAGAHAQVISVPSTYVLPTSAADTSKSGFIWRMSQVASVTGFVQNSAARAEAQLAGQLGENTADPGAQGIASGPGTGPDPASAPIEFIIPTVINVDRGGGSSGNFTPDDQMPGSPGLSGTDNQAAEVLTWLELPAGEITMGVNSDDGFRLTIGGGSPVDKIGSTIVGQYEGGRGAADSIFTFRVSQAGLYAARLIWYNGGSDSRVEWFSVKQDGTKVLINDTANSGIKAYYGVTGATSAFITEVSPISGATGVAPNATITARIQEGARSIDPATVSMTVDGQPVTATATKTGNVVNVSYTPTTLFNSLTTHTVAVSFTDDGVKSGQWTFTVAYVGQVPASLKATPDTTKPGFVFRVSQVGAISGWRSPKSGGTDINSNDRTDYQLAGLLKDEDGTASANIADPNARGAALAVGTAPSPANTPITFEVDSAINLNAVGGSSAGSFPNDAQLPGTPGTSGISDNLAAEVLTYLELPAGLITMGVNSDDGFRVSAGHDLLTGVLLGEFNGGRGVADSTFSFIVQEAGVYPFRLTYENGTSDASLEWFTVQGTTKTLINSTGGVKAYRAVSGVTPPRVTSATPLPGLRAFNQVSSSLILTIADGTNPIDANSVKLTLDGETVTTTAAREGNQVRVTYTPTTLQIPGNVRTANLTFNDSTGATHTRNWQFRNLNNIVLPASAAATENFNSTEEGAVPTGWVELNFTDCSGEFCTTPGLDLDSLHSDSYKGWVVVSRERVEGLKSRITQGPAAGQVVNGQAVEAIGEGNILYAESDVRSADQVQFITTKAFDLSNVNSVVLAFDSLYEQNQDNIGSLEYSVDGGTTWLPVVYYIDSIDGGGDIRFKTDGSVDAVATLTNPALETASWTDPVTNQTKGDTYGAFIAAPITEALSPYIVARVNDDPVEGKRVEVYRLWQADRKSDVRLRFAFGGTASWYWGVDNIAFYDASAPGTAPGASTPPDGEATLSFARTAGGLTLTYTGRLQSADNVTGPYTDVAGATSPHNVTATGSAKFYRAAQ